MGSLSRSRINVTAVFGASVRAWGELWVGGILSSSGAWDNACSPFKRRGSRLASFRGWLSGKGFKESKREGALRRKRGVEVVIEKGVGVLNDDRQSVAAFLRGFRAGSSGVVRVVGL